MTRWRHVWKVSLLLFLAAGATAQGEPPELTVTAAESPPVVDGDLTDGVWAEAAAFQVMREKDLIGHGKLLRVGRQLYVAYKSELSAWGLGIRFNFIDPVSGRTNALLVQPLAPGIAPLLSFRSVPERPAVPIVCEECALRFDLSSEKSFAFELRVPLDLIEVPRSRQEHRLSVEAWDLEARRPLGYFPFLATGMGGKLLPARIRPAGDWGMTAKPERVERNEGLALLEALAAERRAAPDAESKAPPVLAAFTGWTDGKRRDAPLAALEKRLLAAIDAYPEYVALRATLVQVRKARNDFEGALAAHRELGERYPLMQAVPLFVLAETELLRSLGRYDEAAKKLATRPELLKAADFARRDLVHLRALAATKKREAAWRKEEAARDDLPRVRVEIEGKGAFVIELFEDDAPNAVANFISLAERGFYVGTRFHWVEGGRRAIGGDPNSKDETPHNDGFGDPGYLIESEPSRRLNLPFAVAFADKRRSRRTEGSTFVIHLSPFPEIDGVNSVFGRVIQGHDVVRKIEHYDVIDKTTVLRKRDRAYEPVKRAP